MSRSWNWWAKAGKVLTIVVVAIFIAWRSYEYNGPGQFSALPGLMAAIFVAFLSLTAFCVLCEETEPAQE